MGGLSETLICLVFNSLETVLHVKEALGVQIQNLQCNCRKITNPYTLETHDIGDLYHTIIQLKQMLVFTNANAVASVILGAYFSL